MSEAQWWERTAQLALRRLGDPDDDRISWFSSRQIDARQLIFALCQLLTAERLQQAALEDLDMDQSVRDGLDVARHAFEHALPGIKHMRDALVHFEDWARGKGRGPQKQRVLAGTPLREAAAEFWGFEYDPMAGTITLGPYIISVAAIESAAVELAQAIYVAAQAVDSRNAARLHAKVVGALNAAGISFNKPSAPLRVTVGHDRKVWFSFLATDGSNDGRSLWQAVIDALAFSELRLASASRPEVEDTCEEFLLGRSLMCVSSTEAN